MQVERNRLSEYAGRSLLCITHSDRPMQEASCDINYLERRYESRFGRAPLQPFEALRPSHEYTTYLGSVSLYDVGADGRREPELVCAFRPVAYKPQHALWDGERLWVLGAEQIDVYDAQLRSIREIRDPWLACSHTIAADGRGGILVSCSASDSVLTINAETGVVVKAQRVPEHIYGSNYPLRRHDSVVDHFIANDHQLTHVNCAWPWRGGVLISTLIQGAVGWFDPGGEYHELLRGFVGCHGARARSDADEIFFSDSCSGMLMFVDLQGSLIRRVGTGSRWLHDAIQIGGDIFAAAPFDQNEVQLLDVGTRQVISRIDCGAHGGAQFLSFGVPQADHGPPQGGHYAPTTMSDHGPPQGGHYAPTTMSDLGPPQGGHYAPTTMSDLGPPRGGHYSSALRRGELTTGRALIDAALRRQEQALLRARDAVIAEHTEQMRARDAIIADLRSELADTLVTSARTIADLDAARAQEVGLRDRMLADQQAEHVRAVNERDAIAARLRQAHAHAVSARDATIAELTARQTGEVGKRDATIAELSAANAREVGARDAMIAALGAEQANEARRRDAAIAELRALYASEVEKRDAIIAELSAQQAREVGKRDAIIAELSADHSREVGKRDAMLADLGALRTKELAQHDTAIAELRARIEALQDEATEAVDAGEALRLDLAFATRGWRRWVAGRRKPL